MLSKYHVLPFFFDHKLGLRKIVLFLLYFTYVDKVWSQAD